uniref:Uncharacterized protein n=1 Tax=Knipowitschia caucasica TaxID=637954 RepID=A0AAV2L5W4_KNICA
MIQAPQIQNWSKTPRLLGHEKITGVITPGLQQRIYRLDGTLGQEGGELLIQDKGFCRVREQSNLDPARQVRPASELQTVSVGQCGNHPRIPSSSSPTLELLMGKMSDARP